MTARARSGAVLSRLASRVDARIALLVAFAATSGSGYAITLTAGWLLAPDDFGLIATIQTVAFVIGLILDSALSWPLSRALARASETDQPALMRGALAGNLAISAAAALGMVGLFAAGPLRPLLETWTVTVALAAAFPGLAIATAVRATWIGLDRVPAAAGIQTTEAGVKTLAVVGLLALGAGPTGAALGVAIGAWVAAGIALVSIRALLRPLWPLRLDLPHRAEILGSFAALVGIAVALNSDLLLVKSLAPDGGREAALYQAAITISRVPYFLTVALIPLFFTRFVHFDGQGQALTALRRVALVVLVGVAVIETGLALAGPTLLGWLLPETYGSSSSILAISAIGHVPACLCAVLVVALQARGRGPSAARAVLAIVAVQITALVLIVPSAGAIGAVLVSATTFTALAALLSWVTFRPMTVKAPVEESAPISNPTSVARSGWTPKTAALSPSPYRMEEH